MIIFDSQMKKMTHRPLTGGSVVRDQQLITIPGIKCKKSEKSNWNIISFNELLFTVMRKGLWKLSTDTRVLQAQKQSTKTSKKKSEIDQFAVKRPKTNSQDNWKLNPYSGYIAFNTTVCK